MELTLNEKFKLFEQFISNDGLDTIRIQKIRDDLSKIKKLSSGEVDPATVSSLARATIAGFMLSQDNEPFAKPGTLPTYQTFYQKSNYFKNIMIDTEEEFAEIFNEHIVKQDILYRGLSHAKYRLFNSLQRHLILNQIDLNEEEFKKWLVNLVKNTKEHNNYLLQDHFSMIRDGRNSDLSVLAFLQHYKCPTPLIDWTYNFLNALYFASDKIDAPSNAWETENYFSVYFLSEEYLKPNNICELAGTQLKLRIEEEKRELVKRMVENGSLEEKANEMLTEDWVYQFLIVAKGRPLIDDMTKIERLIKLPVSFISDFRPTDDRLTFNINNNINIVIQQGAFIWNSSPKKPLEQVMYEFNNAGSNNNSIFCSSININKRLQPFVKTCLRKNKISKKSIYPNLYTMSNEIFKKSVKNIKTA